MPPPTSPPPSGPPDAASPGASAAQTLVCRRATPADRDVLLPLMAAFNAVEGIAWDETAGRAALERLLADRALGWALLACVPPQPPGPQPSEPQPAPAPPDAPVGCAVVTFGYDLEYAGRDAYLTEFFLVPAYRGRGLAAHLLAAAEAQARVDGVRALHLLVRPDNGPALATYRRAGFAPSERIFLSKPLD